nr:hypothetical protein BaRGS_023507 [Batillaria attramentaria]
MAECLETVCENAKTDSDAEGIAKRIADMEADLAKEASECFDTIQDLKERKAKKKEKASEEEEKEEADKNQNKVIDDSDETEDSEDADADDDPEEDVFELPDEPPSKFKEVYSDTESEEEEEEEEDESEEEDFSKGINAFINKAKQRREERNSHEGDLRPEDVGIENRLLGCATFEKKFVELAEQFTNCTLMCYLPGFSLAGFGLEEMIGALRQDPEMCEIETDLKKWQQKNLEAYQAQVCCVKKMQHEIISLKLVMKRQSDLLNKLMDDNESVRKERLKADDSHYMVRGHVRSQTAPYDHAQDVSIFCDIAAQFKQAMSADPSVKMQYDVSSINKVTI